MSVAARPPSGPNRGVAVSRRSLASFLLAFVRNPLRAFPPEVFHEPMVSAPLAGRARLYVCDPALIHEALVRNADRLDKTEVFQRVLRPALGNGLLTAEGADWRRQRQSAAPAFQHGRLVGFLPAMIAAAERTRDRWLAAGPGATVDVGREMTRTTFAIIADTMLSGPTGLDVDRVERGIAGYLDATSWAGALALLGAPDWVPHPGRRRARAAASWLRTAVRAMVAERRRAATGPDDLVSLLLAARDPETGRAMTDEEVTDNLLTFITAGHETTAQGLGWTLRLLADHPAVVAAMLDEIDAVTGGGALRPEHVADLALTRQAFSEAMRLYPPAPVVTRRVARGFDLGGLAVPAGTGLIVPIYAVHRHARLWDDPDGFDPGRFAPERVKARHRFGYLPFGAGPRSCIGSAFALAEAVAILAVLIRSVRLSGTAPLAEPVMRITLRPARPTLMRVEARSRTSEELTSPPSS